ELAAEMSAAALGEERVLRVQLYARLIGRGVLAVPADAHVAGSDAFHRLGFVQHFGGGEAGEDLDAERFGLLRKPAANVSEARDVVAVVLEGVGQEKAGR